MKRIVILIVLVTIAAVAGVVRSSVGSVSELRGLVSHHNASDVREEIRQTYELSPGARVEISGLNGSVKIETSDTRTAEIYIERTAGTQEALDRRRIAIEDASRYRDALGVALRLLALVPRVQIASAEHTRLLVIRASVIRH